MVESKWYLYSGEFSDGPMDTPMDSIGHTFYEACYRGWKFECLDLDLYRECGYVAHTKRIGYMPTDKVGPMESIGVSIGSSENSPE